MTQIYLACLWMISLRTTQTKTWWTLTAGDQCACWIHGDKLKASSQTLMTKEREEDAIMRVARTLIRSHQGGGLVVQLVS